VNESSLAASAREAPKGPKGDPRRAAGYGVSELELSTSPRASAASGRHARSASRPSGSISGSSDRTGPARRTSSTWSPASNRSDQGSIRSRRRHIGAKRPAQIAAAGVARSSRTFVFSSQMSVIDNVLRSPARRSADRVFMARPPHGGVSRRRKAPGAKGARSCSNVFELGRPRRRTVDPSLSYGDQRGLEIAARDDARAQALLLDEPAAGMNYGVAEG